MSTLFPSMIGNTLILRAQSFAKGAHAGIGQVRKYNGEPYYNHVYEVARLLELHAVEPISPEQICAAYLHDTVEDTKVTIEQILYEFGREIAELVGWLTDVSQPTDGNRKVRKRIDLLHTKDSPRAAKTVKLADLISNSNSIVKEDPGFAVTYLAEKAALMEVLTDSDPGLYAEAQRVLAEGLVKIGPKPVA